MEKRVLGKTGLKVTALGYGAMELMNMDEKDSIKILNEVLDGGINYVDTSPDYGPSEEFVGKAISHRRSEFILASKCGCNLSGHGEKHIWTREMLQKNIENSLKLLKTDYIDVWQMHGTMPEDLVNGRDSEAVQALLDIKKQGKVRYVGISYKNANAKEPLYPADFAYKGIQEFINWELFDVMQIVYGCLTRKNETAIAKAAEKGFGIIVRGVIKKYFENYPEIFKKAKLNELMQAGESMDALLIRFAMNHPGIGTMIIGTKSIEHLKENIKAARSGCLAKDVYEEAKKRLDAVGVTAGEFM